MQIEVNLTKRSPVKFKICLFIILHSHLIPDNIVTYTFTTQHVITYK